MGEGSYGSVYKASMDLGNSRIYSAIKIIRIPSNENEIRSMILETGSREAARAYFGDVARECLQEITSMNMLKGITNIVSVEDSRIEENSDGSGWTIYIRMELLTSFQEYRLQKNLAEEDVIRLGMDLCSALAYCEKVNIIHRDIKPSNVFVSELGDYKLGDFGVSRRLDLTNGLYSKKGSDFYMAPEVFTGQPYDRRADIYSLGLMLYKQMNRNRDPFVDITKPVLSYRDRNGAQERRIGGEKLPPPADASEALAKVILKACDADPKKRYQTAEEFRAALEQIGPGKPGRKKTAVWIAAAAAALILLAAAAVFLPRGGEKPPQDTPAVTAAEPAAEPTDKPTAAPTEEPTATPTAEPTAAPAAEAKLAAEPTAEPTAAPTEEPTATPTEEPTAAPTAEPTPAPTAEPTATPTEEPTAAPTKEPTAAPTEEPTAAPTAEPTPAPTAKPDAAAAGTQPLRVRIKEGGASIRNYPDGKLVVSSIRQNEEVVVTDPPPGIEPADGWYYVYYEGTYGWISAGRVEIVSPENNE